jgi:membrane protein
MGLTPAAQFALQLWRKIEEDDVLTGAAAVAFFLLLSIFPAAIFTLSLLPFLPIPDLERAVMDLIHQALPDQSAILLERIVGQVLAEREGGVLTLGLALTLWSASMGLYAAMKQIARTHSAGEPRQFWKARMTAVILMFLLLFLLFGTLSLLIIGGAAQDRMAAALGWGAPLRWGFAILRRAILALLLLTGLELLYYLGRGGRGKFRPFSAGGLAALVMIAAVSMGFQAYITHIGNYRAMYGSLGAVIVLMLWLYLVSIALLTGSEINAVRRKPGRRTNGGNPGSPGAERDPHPSL